MRELCICGLQHGSTLLGQLIRELLHGDLYTTNILEILAFFPIFVKNSNLLIAMKTLTELRKTHTLRPMKELTEEQQELVFTIQMLEFEYINNDLTEEETLKKLKDINHAYEEGENLKIFEQ